MLERFVLGVAGILIALLGVYFILGGSRTAGSDTPMTWLGAVVLTLVLAGGIGSSAYDTLDGIRHHTLRLASFGTFCVLTLFAIVALALLSSQAYPFTGVPVW